MIRSLLLPFWCSFGRPFYKIFTEKLMQFGLIFEAILEVILGHRMIRIIAAICNTNATIGAFWEHFF